MAKSLSRNLKSITRAEKIALARAFSTCIHSAVKGGTVDDPSFLTSLTAKIAVAVPRLAGVVVAGSVVIGLECHVCLDASGTQETIVVHL